MTAIAEQSEASIGTLYDYFPDKPALARALLAQYTDESDAHWKVLLSNPSSRLTKTGLADIFVEGALDFVRQRPAYLPLLRAPIAFVRTPATRLPLRRTIADALQMMHKTMSADRAFVSAQVIVELIKALLSIYKQTTPKDRELVAEEYRKLLRLYLLAMPGKSRVK